MLPKDFTDYPYNSPLKNPECETVARNIMIILSRTGGVFRELSWDEYKEERINDGNFSELEKQYFDKVIKYCKSEDTANIFWNRN